MSIVVHNAWTPMMVTLWSSPAAPVTSTTTEERVSLSSYSGTRSAVPVVTVYSKQVERGMFSWGLVTCPGRRRSSGGLDFGARASSSSAPQRRSSEVLRTCRFCKKQFDPLQNHPRACRFHVGHFGGETKRKFESVYTGGTLDTVGGGEIIQYWHCCGSKDPYNLGCEAAPHRTYDD